jgi:hypothetical protein
MAKLKTYTRDGFYWLVAETNGKQHWLHRQAPVGHCIRPGQKFEGEGQAHG